MKKSKSKIFWKAFEMRIMFLEEGTSERSRGCRSGNAKEEIKNLKIFSKIFEMTYDRRRKEKFIGGFRSGKPNEKVFSKNLNLNL